MKLAQVIVSQYQAALAMLKQTIAQCPDTLWDNPADKTRFWHIAYHALFYTHLYVQEIEATFTPWPQHRPEYQFIGPVPWPPHAPPQIGAPYNRDTVLDYLAFCQREVAQRVPQLDLAAASGFDWLPFSKFEHLLYTLRHLQQHTGELMERLGTRANIEIDWVSRQPA